MSSSPDISQTVQDLMNEIRTLAAEAEKALGQSVTEHSEETFAALRARLDAAQERLDEAVGHLLAEALRDHLADGGVAGRQPDREGCLLAHAGEAGVAEHPRGGERLQVGRDAHDRARHRPQHAAGEDPRGGRRGVDHRQPERGGQCHPLRPSGQHRLGTDVHPDPR